MGYRAGSNTNSNTAPSSMHRFTPLFNSIAPVRSLCPAGTTTLPPPRLVQWSMARCMARWFLAADAVSLAPKRLTVSSLCPMVGSEMLASICLYRFSSHSSAERRVGQQRKRMSRIRRYNVLVCILMGWKSVNDATNLGKKMKRNTFPIQFSEKKA